MTLQHFIARVKKMLPNIAVHTVHYDIANSEYSIEYDGEEYCNSLTMTGDSLASLFHDLYLQYKEEETYNI